MGEILKGGTNSFQLAVNFLLIVFLYSQFTVIVSQKDK